MNKEELKEAYRELFRKKLNLGLELKKVNHDMARLRKLLLSIFIYYFLLLIFLGGCSEVDTSYTNEQIDNKLSNLQNQINSQNARTKELEEVQEANIYSIADLIKQKTKQSQSKYDDEELPQGCVSEEKLNFWFEKYQKGEINKRQYNTIQRNYNKCH